MINNNMPYHPTGTKRVNKENLKEYIKKEDSWMLSMDKLPKDTFEIINEYKQNNTYEILVDNFLKEFLKGHITPDNKPAGQRIKILPNGKNLSGGGFNLFAKNLKYNKNSNSNWAICYENTSGSKTYLYDEDNIHLEKEKKKKLIDSFSNNYQKIKNKLEKDLKEKKGVNYLTLWILLKTKARVGNLEYFKHLGHKGITTLQKKDIKIKNSTIIINYLGKDAIPQEHIINGPDYIIEQLKIILNNKNNEDFVFANKDGHPIYSHELTDILFKYTNEHFYPHIIRSFYADNACREFLMKNQKASKKQVLEEYKKIATELGHKKFNKKKNTWEPDYKVTLNNYIREELVNNMKNLYEN